MSLWYIALILFEKSISFDCDWLKVTENNCPTKREVWARAYA